MAFSDQQVVAFLAYLMMARWMSMISNRTPSQAQSYVTRTTDQMPSCSRSVRRHSTLLSRRNQVKSVAIGGSTGRNPASRESEIERCQRRRRNDASSEDWGQCLRWQHLTEK